MNRQGLPKSDYSISVGLFHFQPGTFLLFQIGEFEARTDALVASSD
jgi:hypothetical protein